MPDSDAEVAAVLTGVGLRRSAPAAIQQNACRRQARGWWHGLLADDPGKDWSAGIEYDHLFMGHANNSFTTTDPRLTGFLNDRISQDVDMVTLRVNYRFGWGGAPVVSKY